MHKNTLQHFQGTSAPLPMPADAHDPISTQTTPMQKQNLRLMAEENFVKILVTTEFVVLSLQSTSLGNE